MDDADAAQEATRGPVEELAFAADLARLAHSRQWVAERARSAGAAPHTERVVVLLTSELVSNAVKYGPVGGHVAVRVTREDGALRVDVADQGRQSPVMRRPEPTAASGRGLMFVDVLASEWGVDHPAGGGKRVWFRVRL